MRFPAFDVADVGKGYESGLPGDGLNRNEIVEDFLLDVERFIGHDEGGGVVRSAFREQDRLEKCVRHLNLIRIPDIGPVVIVNRTADDMNGGLIHFCVTATPLFEFEPKTFVEGVALRTDIRQVEGLFIGILAPGKIRARRHVAAVEVESVVGIVAVLGLGAVLDGRIDGEEVGTASDGLREAFGRDVPRRPVRREGGVVVGDREALMDEDFFGFGRRLPGRQDGLSREGKDDEKAEEEKDDFLHDEMYINAG